jgi:hypothetical protein
MWLALLLFSVLPNKSSDPVEIVDLIERVNVYYKGELFNSYTIVWIWSDKLACYKSREAFWGTPPIDQVDEGLYEVDLYRLWKYPKFRARHFSIIDVDDKDYKHSRLKK